MAIKSAKKKTWTNAFIMTFYVFFNILFYMVVIIFAFNLSHRVYSLSYQVFGNVGVENEPGTDVIITIKKDETVSYLADELVENNVIQSRISFWVRAKLMVNQSNPMLPGIYRLNTSMDNGTIIDTITDPSANLASKDS